MNWRDWEENFLKRDLLGGNSTQRLIEEAERRAMRENSYGQHNLMNDPLSRMSEAERRFLTEPRPEFERLLALRSYEVAGGLPRATESAMERMRQIAEGASKYHTGAELNSYFERVTQTGRQALAAFGGQNQVERMLGAADAGWERMMRSERLLARAGGYELARDSATAYYSSVDAMTKRLAEIDAFGVSAGRYTAGLMEPFGYHARFTQETLDKLTEVSPGAREAAALRGSLTLFNDQLTRLTAAVAPLIVTPSEASVVRPARVSPNLPAAQQKELLERAEEVPDEADYEELSPLAPSSQIADDTIACVLLYERCNEARLFRGEEPFFKPTTRGVVAACRIATIVADDRDKFDSLIDQLYMLIYEGAGGTKQKYLVENGGVMERPECDAVWDIKQLRSKRSRHDIGHGSEGEIRKKYRDLKGMYRRLGLSRLPQTPEEYVLLQRAVVRNLRAFLTELAERIENRAGSPSAG